MSALEADDRFGSAIAYSGERLAIGAAGDDGINNHRRNSGAVYLFDVPGGSTSQISFNSMIGRGYQEENRSGARSTGVADLGGLDTFGASVAMDGTRLIVGAPNDDGEGNSTSNVGKVCTFALEDGAQTALNKVNIIGDSHFGDGTALSLDAGDKLGMSVSLDQGRIMIGAEGDDGATNRVQDAGAVYLYSTGSDGLGDLTLEGIIGDGYVGGKNVNLTDLQAGDRFGAGVSLDGARLAVGAPGDDGGLNDNPDTGIVYLFTFNNSLFGNGTLDRTLGGDVRRRVDFQGERQLSARLIGRTSAHPLPCKIISCSSGHPGGASAAPSRRLVSTSMSLRLSHSAARSALACLGTIYPRTVRNPQTDRST